MPLRVATRVGQALLTLWAASVVTWALLLLAPGDPARTVLAARGVNQPSPALVEATRVELGVQGTVFSRYWHWLIQALHGNFGTSWQSGRPVTTEFAERLPATARLALVAMLIAIGLALVLGLGSAAAPGGWLDRLLRALTLLMVVTPGFLVGLFILDVLVVRWNIGVVIANGSWSTVGWPALTLALGSAGYWGRILRASALEARSTSYLRVSAARGASRWRQLLVHVLPNALPPLLTVVGFGCAALLGGAPIAESVFSWPGVGQYTVQAINARDLPVVLAFTMIAVTTYIAASLVIDLLLMAADPRLRESSNSRGGRSQPRNSRQRRATAATS